MTGPWQAAGYDSVVRDGTTHSMPVRVLVPVDKDSWRLSDDDYDAMRADCAARVVEALNRAEPTCCDYEDCTLDGEVRIGDQAFCGFHMADGLMAELSPDERSVLMRVHMPHDAIIPRDFAAELISAITDLRECDANQALTAANARAQRLAMTLGEMLGMSQRVGG